MASAQVLPNSSVSSRKQGHLEAGKKKLEEFRKRKAEGRAKKAFYTDQSQSTDGGNNDKSSLNQEHERGEATSSRITGLSVSHTSPMQEEAYSFTVEHAISSNENLADEHGLVIKNHFPSGMGQHFENTHMSNLYEKPAYTSLINGYHDHWIDKSELTDKDQPKFETANVATTDQITTFNLDKAKFDFENSLSSSTFSPALQSDDHINSSTVRMSYLDASTSNGLDDSESMFPESRFGLPTTSLGSSSSYEDSTTGLAIYNLGSNNNSNLVDSQIGWKTISESISQHLSLGSEVWHRSEPSLIDSAPPIGRSQEVRPSPSTSYGMTSGRSRPSFLDTLGVSRGSSTYLAPLYETQKPNPHVSLSDTMVQSADVHSPSQLPVAYMNTLQQTSSSSTLDMVNEKLNSFVSSSDMQMLEGSREYLQKGHEVLAPKKDEDFSALEQHIEDLTQEKFSLQRTLDASRTLAESLATENSSLTESYNQQAKFVGELKSEIERWQAEVVDQLRAVESLKMEYANAQLECNAADERAKILASEVIGLEEKALKLRSNELKLEKQVENLASEIASYKYQVSILEKEHQDFQSTINAMQEEKKLLQSKIRKVSSHSKVDDPIKVFSSRRDISTSTDDLGDDIDRQTSDVEAMASNPMSVLRNNTPSNDSVTTSTLLPDDRTLYLSDVSVGIPHDQLRMIDNIGSLLSELALEKEELIQALTMQTSNSSKLKDLNKELSRKLEAQTQRLELLTAQRMANENILPKPTDAPSIPDTMQYADEGDEVVERVLGWIMKFFPGGSSKRRTSKLL